MTATTVDRPQIARPRARPPRVPLSRLVRVELRKIIDTRAGRWLLISIGLLTAAIIVIFFFAGDQVGPHVRQLRRGHRDPAGLPAPGARHPGDHQRVVPTHRPGDVHPRAEPSPGRGGQVHRDGAARPGRRRARLRARRGRQRPRHGAAGRLRLLELPARTGSARSRSARSSASSRVSRSACCCMSSAAAIVIYYVVPIAWSILFNAVSALNSAAPWVDLGTATTSRCSTTTMSSSNWEHLGVTTLIWVGLPLVVGAVPAAAQRSEVAATRPRA